MLDQKLKDSAQRVANQYAKFANKTLGCNLRIPVKVEFTLQEITSDAAGMAYSVEEKINLHSIYFKNNVSDFLNNIIPHEISHLVQFDLYDNRGIPTSSHGAIFMDIGRKLGVQLTKSVNYDSKEAKAYLKNVKKRNSKISD